MATVDFRGIYPSLLCPFDADFRLDEDALAQHASTLASVNGVRGVLVNGHAGENTLLTREEAHSVVAVVREAVGSSTLVVAGISSESSLAAATLALDAQSAGADALMIFAPPSWALGQDGAVALTHHQRVTAHTDLPVMLFQGSVRAGQIAYTPAVLRALLALPRVVAVKEGSWDSAAYEATRRLAAEAAPHVAIMASGDEHLLACFVLGSEGSLVSLAVLIPEIIVALDEAVRRSDLSEARRLNDVVYPLAKAIYGTAPSSWVTARLKAALHMLGRLPNRVTRPPLSDLPAAELRRLEEAVEGIA